MSVSFYLLLSWAYSALARTIFGKIISSQENKWYTWKTWKTFLKNLLQEASTTQANLARK